jgi:hypothetical protein
MSQLTVTPAVSQQTATPGVSHPTVRLLTAGIVAGPLFLVLWALQAFTRDGFDPGRHPISLLSLGDLGWIQIANFVVTGALFVACAVGLRRVLRRGRRPASCSVVASPPSGSGVGPERASRPWWRPSCSVGGPTWTASPPAS